MQEGDTLLAVTINVRIICIIFIPEAECTGTLDFEKGSSVYLVSVRCGTFVLEEYFHDHSVLYAECWKMKEKERNYLLMLIC